MENFLVIVGKIALVLLFITFVVGFYRIVYALFAFLPTKRFAKSDKKGKFVILIAARNESNVIERLLKSIKSQNYDSELIDACVIVEDINDKTVDITKAYGYDFFVRTNLNNKGKGYALDEAITWLKSEKRKYDGYFIIDADNILKEDFVSIMNDAFQSGGRVLNGYHAPINTPGNIVADCSLLTFSSINSFQNKARNYFTKNIVMTGTGLFIDSSLIDQWGGWPFHTLTEDYELSYWCCANNVSTYYVPNAVFYDESAVDKKTLFNQRVRWIRGYGQVKKRLKKQMIKGFFSKNFLARLDFTLGVIPNVLVLITFFSYWAVTFTSIVICALLKMPGLMQAIMGFITCNLALYIFLMIYTVLQLEAEKEYFKPDAFQILKIVFYYPIFIMNYIPQALTAIFKKEIKWVPIKHGNVELEKKSNESLEQEEDNATVIAK